MANNSGWSIQPGAVNIVVGHVRADLANIMGEVGSPTGKLDALQTQSVSACSMVPQIAKAVGECFSRGATSVCNIFARVESVCNGTLQVVQAYSDGDEAMARAIQLQTVDDSSTGNFAGTYNPNSTDQGGY